MVYLKYLRWLVAAVVFILCILAFSGKFYGIQIFNAQFAALTQNALLTARHIARIADVNAYSDKKINKEK